MARQDPHTEYIISKEVYNTLIASLPATGTVHQKFQSAAVSAMQYRQKTGEKINAGKWSMWGISSEVFDFEWRNGAWHPPANLFVRTDL